MCLIFGKRMKLRKIAYLFVLAAVLTLTIYFVSPTKEVLAEQSQNPSMSVTETLTSIAKKLKEEGEEKRKQFRGEEVHKEVKESEQKSEPEKAKEEKEPVN